MDNAMLFHDELLGNHPLPKRPPVAQIEIPLYEQRDWRDNPELLRRFMAYSLRLITARRRWIYAV